MIIEIDDTGLAEAARQGAQAAAEELLKVYFKPTDHWNREAGKGRYIVEEYLGTYLKSQDFKAIVLQAAEEALQPTVGALVKELIVKQTKETLKALTKTKEVG